jgi:hypothetical protein
VKSTQKEFSGKQCLQVKEIYHRRSKLSKYVFPHGTTWKNRSKQEVFFPLRSTDFYIVSPMLAIRQALGAFAKQQRKAAVIFSMSFFCMEQRDSLWTHFRDISYLELLL